MRIAASVVTGLFCWSLGCALQAGENPASRTSALALDGRPVDPFQSAKTTVLLFVRTDCPISNRYAPEVRRLQEKFGSKGFEFWLVYPDPDESADAIRHHVREFDYPCRVLRDPQHVMVQLSQATVTPEAAVFTVGGRLIYHGRIDDRNVDLSHTRPAPNSRDLEEVLHLLSLGDPVPATSAPAIGCTISPLP